MPPHGVVFGEPQIDLDAAARLERRRGQTSSPAASPAWPSSARSGRPRHGRLPAPNRSRSRARAAKTRQLRPGDHRRGLARRSSCPVVPDDPRVIDSTGALELPRARSGCWWIGGGIIGLEMATVFDALGSRVTVVELMDHLIPGADPDIVSRCQADRDRYDAIHLKTKVTAVEAQDEGLKAPVRRPEGAASELRPRAGRRRPRAQRRPDQRPGRGRRRRRARLHRRPPAAHQRAPHLRHRRRRRPADAGPQGGARGQGRGRGRRPAKERLRRAGDPLGRLHRPGGRLGRAHRERRQGQGRRVRKAPSPGRPRAARSGRARARPSCSSTAAPPVGAGIVGPNAGDLISELALAIEMGSEAADLGLTVHPHPTLSETVAMAAEVFEGTVTDLIRPRSAAWFSTCGSHRRISTRSSRAG